MITLYKLSSKFFGGRRKKGQVIVMGSISDEGDRPWQSYHTVFTNAKAGMDGVDKEKVQKIVYEMSKGSKFFVNEQRKDADIKQKIESLRVQCAKLTENDIFHFQKIADRRISELEASRDLSQIWLHSDMDAFYAAVETLGNPQLKEMPLAVGSMSMICTANYEARKYGVRAAMPGFIARKLCPDLIFVPTNFEKYTYYSELTRKVFQKYDPCFIATSLDEAYINITEICLKRGVSGDEIAAELRNAIYEETGLTCSAGVAPNRLLAKVCSDINKPNGQYTLPNDRNAVMAFITSLPIRKIGGIGKVTENILKDVFGINNCEQMLQKSPLLCAMFSHSSADFFLSVSLGLGGTHTPQFKSRKSMSNERTFSATDKEALLFQNLEELAESLSNDMQKESLYGRTLTLKLKTASFEVRTRALSTTKYIQSKGDILKSAVKLLKPELPLSLRLMGLRMSQFQDNNHASLDTTQKTLTNYFCSGNSNARSTISEIHDEKMMVDSKCDGIFFSDDILYNHIPCDDSNELGESSMNSTESCKNQKKENSEKPSDLNEMNKAQTSPLLMSNDTTTTTAPSKLKEQKGWLVWVDDYICSICEIQLPPSFTKERQEHVDFHIAERLQNEEFEGSNSTDSICLDRFRESKRRAEENPLKKRKASSKNSSNYIPIDSFFVKTSKNH